MELNLVAFLFGAILLAVAVLGGGFELKELKVPKVSWFPRFVSALLGMFFIVLGIGLEVSIDPSSSPIASSTQQSPSEVNLLSPIASSPTQQSPNEIEPPSPIASSLTQQSPNEVEAVIDDPDGYTNIRSGQGTQHSIIVRVNEGEVFYVIPQQSKDWWPVRTKDNKYGYMHRSRIRVQN
jgi:hypothetical protein